MAIYAFIQMANLVGFPQGFELHNPRATAPDTGKTMGPADVRKMLNALFLNIGPLENFKDRRMVVHG